MATLALTVAGAAVGSALLPAGIGILGTTISGAAVALQTGGTVERTYQTTGLVWRLRMPGEKQGDGK